jgi:Ca2+-binding RTX toxin-like protein
MRARSVPFPSLGHWRLVLILACVSALALAQTPVRAAPGDTSDISITGSASSPGIRLGHNFAISLTAVNAGPDAAANVEVEVVFDPDVTILDVTAPGGSCVTTPVLVCTATSVAAAGSFRVTARVAPNVTEPVDVTAAAESDSLDLDLTDNTETFSAQVGAASSTCDLWGTAGNDLIKGGAQGEVICGKGGNDRLLGRGGRDRLLGGAGRDVLVGGAGNDVLIGGAGRDRMLGGPGKDRCRAKGGEVRRSCR